MHWDQAVMMPPGGASSRAEQIALLSGQVHKLRTQPDTGSLIKASQDEDLSKWDRRNLDLIEKSWRKQMLLPAWLVEKEAAAAQAAETAWGRARDMDDFSVVENELQASFDVVKQRAELLSDALGEHPYDILMDDFEPGLKQDFVTPIFDEFSAGFPELLNAVQDLQANEPKIISPKGPFPINLQAKLGRDLAAILGFDFEGGRLDVSRHPFSGGTPSDIRMTTRYDEADFTSSLMGTLHETGHSLYEAGLPADYLTQPVGSASGLVAHESQSLLIEMQACRSDAFLTFLADKVRYVFQGSGPAWDTENLIRLYRRVSPGTIRVDADEVTYPAHVMLRYDLERALFSGDLPIRELPGAFSDALYERLGVRPKSHFDGVLQDIHWYSGGFGYFATYTLGAMTAAQFFSAAKEQLDDLEGDLLRGEFSNLLSWLRENIHRKGSLVGTDKMLISTTGRSLDPACFRRHLIRRYLGE